MFKKTFIIILLVISTLLGGCAKLDSIKVSLGFKNNDFEYIRGKKIDKIVIQNTRDKGYRFVVTDQSAIEELYKILSTAKEAKEKSILKPDYIFEIHESHDKVHKFQYVAGLDKKNGGNLYSDDKIYIVSKRIDNDIIKSFWNIRVPKDFTDIYYSSILKTLNEYVKNNKGEKTLGVNLKDDIDVGKFILSTDLEDLKSKLSNKYEGITLIEEDLAKQDIIMTVKTQGYRRTLYKSIITFNDKVDKKELKYYIVGEYKNTDWSLSITTEKPDKF
ncbi:lipoprotein [Clostridium malenominatum]|uniref:Lipoprotein n=1 Tax=Clostridium malenominatum TaxID=1539 RepID=A0ABN1J4J2_9CLOT